MPVNGPTPNEFCLKLALMKGIDGGFSVWDFMNDKGRYHS